MTPCSQAHEFFDGELVAKAATAYRDHLAQCPQCQAELHAVMQLTAASDLCITDLTTEDVFDALDAGLVPFILAWEALGQPGPRRDDARRAVVAALAMGRS